jgi:hypothetical protein
MVSSTTSAACRPTGVSGVTSSGAISITEQ